MLYGKPVNVVIVVSPIGYQNVHIQYKGSTIERISDGPDLIVPISIEALPAAYSLEIPLTLQFDEVIPSGANVSLSSYVSGFQGAWGYSKVTITPGLPRTIRSGPA